MVFEDSSTSSTRAHKKGRFFGAYIIGFFLVLLVGSITTFLWIAGGLSEPFGDRISEGTTVTIEEGTGMRGVIAKLKDAGLIEHPFFAFGLQSYVVLNELDTKLKFGEYEVAPTDTLETLINKIAGGDAADHSIRVTFPEGLTRDQVLDVFVDKGFDIDASTVESLESSLRKSYEFLGEADHDVFMEGYLFPDTYKFEPDASVRALLEQMLGNTQQRLLAVTEKERITANDTFDIPVLSRAISLHELMIIASLVEREVDADEDRPVVAGIILNRLEQNFPLQLDATVNYITGKNDPGVAIVDTEIDSPYNTYRNVGLPIGPIANPGKESIAAVLNAKASPYFYYLHGLDGEIYYATTFEEHLTNKAKFR